ncbi:hypothetical protein ACH5RR_038121 [Cinchona calisaya]|uniref:Uncharacterized protein n=1 Tax=Cinchona calisaya TaxID=153742 RepID=A0ABD2YCT8_9GENT
MRSKILTKLDGKMETITGLSYVNYLIRVLLEKQIPKDINLQDLRTNIRYRVCLMHDGGSAIFERLRLKPSIIACSAVLIELEQCSSYEAIKRTIMADDRFEWNHIVSCLEITLRFPRAPVQIFEENLMDSFYAGWNEDTNQEQQEVDVVEDANQEGQDGDANRGGEEQQEDDVEDADQEGQDEEDEGEGQEDNGGLNGEDEGEKQEHNDEGEEQEVNGEGLNVGEQEGNGEEINEENEGGQQEVNEDGLIEYIEMDSDCDDRPLEFRRYRNLSNDLLLIVDDEDRPLEFRRYRNLRNDLLLIVDDEVNSNVADDVSDNEDDEVNPSVSDV